MARLYHIKGKKRILDEKYTIKKDNQGKYQTISNILFKGPRGKKQLVHRELSYLAMRVSMNTGIRPGSMRKSKWTDISENTTIQRKKERSGSTLMYQLRRPKQVGRIEWLLPLPSF